MSPPSSLDTRESCPPPRERSERDRSGRRVLLAAGAMVVLGLSAVFAGTYLWAEYHWRAAQKALERFDFDRAQKHLDLCLKARPGSSEALFRAAQTARRQGAAGEAERLLTEWERRHGLSPGSARERALQRAQEGDLAEVEAPLRELVERGDPEKPLILEALARGYTKRRHFPDALRSLDSLLKQQPANYHALIWRGEIHELQRFRHDALEDYQQAVDLRPEIDESRQHLAGMLEELGRIQDAATHYECILQRQPGNAAVTVSLARCRQDLHELAEAQRLLDKLLANRPTEVRALIERARLALRQGQPAAAEEFGRRALAVAPHHRDTLFVLSLSLNALNRTDEARPYFDRGLEMLTHLVRAERLIEKVAETPRDAGLRYQIGVLLMRGGKEADAINWLRSALHDDPGHQPARSALAELTRTASGGALAP